MKAKRLDEIHASIIIPTFNTKNLLEKNLPKIMKAASFVKNNIVEVIVVDDASTDDSYKYVKKNFPEVKLVRHRENRGFSSTVNTGARTAKGNLLVLINSDVVPQKDFLLPVFKHFKNKQVFAVSLHEQGFSWAKGTFKNGFLHHEQGKEVKSVHETFWVSGGSGVFRRDYWMALGGMDEKLLSPFYWEDVDLCYRASKRGLFNLWEPKALVHHKHESTISKLSYKYVSRIRERNELLFHWKNITSPILFRKHLSGLFKKITKHPGYLRIVLMAFLKLRQVLKARKKEKQESKVSDEAIFARF